jgi:hypothetical protein
MIYERPREPFDTYQDRPTLAKTLAAELQAALDAQGITLRDREERPLPGVEEWRIGKIQVVAQYDVVRDQFRMKAIAESE